MNMKYFFRNFYVQDIKNYLVIVNNSNTLLIIVNPSGEIVLSKNDIVVMQIRDTYISVKENDVVGAYNYDGSIVVPFEFKCIYIEENGFLVSKDDKNNLQPYSKE